MDGPFQNVCFSVNWEIQDGYHHSFNIGPHGKIKKQIIIYYTTVLTLDHKQKKKIIILYHK